MTVAVQGQGGSMSNASAAPAIAYQRSALFWICVLALFTAALANALRIGASGAIQAGIFDKFDSIHSAELIGAALGAAFSGFALSLLAVSPLLDVFGAKRVLLFASLCYVCGPLLIALAPALAATPQGAGDLVYWGMGITGLAWGCTEGSINPVVAALFPDNKIGRLSMLHAWWPGGIIVGGLLSALVFPRLALGWQVQVGLVAAPGLLLGLWAATQRFPRTGISSTGPEFRAMIAEPFKHPTFWIFFAIMLLTSSTELAPGSWVDVTLTHTVHMKGILLLVFMSAVMFVMRHFAGPIAHRFSDIGMLWLCTVPAAIGLYLLSLANSPPTAIVAAIVWAFGVCFMWPTMLAAVATRYPRGGSWTIGLTGFAGAMAIQFVLPYLGSIYDAAKLSHAGGKAAFEAAQKAGGTHYAEILAYAAKTSFQTVALIPVVLFFVFGLVWLLERRGLLRGSAR
jgi:MFS family permease